MGEQLPPRRKPRNDLLRNYYGIGNKGGVNAVDTADIGDYLHPDELTNCATV